MRYVCNHILPTLVLAGISVSTFAQVGESNPSQYVAIAEGQTLVNNAVNSQTKGMQKTAALQGSMAAEFTMMKKWEQKYNSYLKTARGYADALKAGTSLYADGVETLRHLYEIRKAINANPTGIGATLAMNDLYLETTTEFIKTYRLLKVSIAKGGTDNMLTGAEPVPSLLASPIITSPMSGTNILQEWWIRVMLTLPTMPTIVGAELRLLPRY